MKFNYYFSDSNLLKLEKIYWYAEKVQLNNFSYIFFTNSFSSFSLKMQDQYVFSKIL